MRRMERERAEQEIASTLGRLAIAPTELGVTSATLPRRGPSVPSRAPLPRVSLVPDPDTDLAIVRELARGGMGVVHLAEQRSLSREVAVKTARTNDAAIVSALVREARIMGALEHPSLVPVHALGIDPEGGPVLVMKRIEGVSWRTLLAAPDHEAWAPLLAGHGDRMRGHVEILAQICRALAFAHDRGVVHRDLKPDNVMIGRFGEVYLLDWGVALRLADAASEPEGIVGTPGYLAPEMARADPRLVDARTDVYLLGATLYELVGGRPPHDAPTPLAALVLALTGEVAPLPEDAPVELVELIAASMAFDPSERTPSAESFRLGLARFLAAREADVLVSDARKARGEADAALAQAGPSSTLGVRRLIEARFALAAARRLRPGDRRARADLDSCLATLGRRDLALGSPTGARTYTSEMEVPDADLLAAIDTAERAVETERKVRAERDTSPLSRALLAAMALLTATWLLWAFAIRGFDEAPVDARSSLQAIAVGSIPLLALAAAMRRRLFATDGTRRLFAFFVLWYLAGPTYLLLSIVRGQAELDLAPMMLRLGFFVAAASLSLLPELWPTVVVHFIAVAMITHDPTRPFVTLSGFFVINALIVVRALWLRGRDASEIARPQGANL